MQDAVSFPADVWSTCATLFHLASGHLPFECPNPMAAFIAIAQDPNAPPPDVRDAAPEGLRSIISNSFATTLKRGLERRLDARLSCADELASALHDCLVEQGEALYTVFISYRVASERFHAALLYELLNNTITPAGHRVIVFLDSRRLVKGAAWEDGFVQGLLHSLVAVPLVSRSFLAPLTTLAGVESDHRDSVALELLLMQALAALSEASPSQVASTDLPSAGLEAIYPIFIGDPCALKKSPVDSSFQSGNQQLGASLSWGNSSNEVSRGSGDFGYPFSGNFFSDCSKLIAAMPDVVSPPTVAAAVKSLSACGVHSQASDALRVRTVRAMVQEILTRQGAELWATGASEPEEIPPDSDILLRMTAEPTQPPLDTVQLGIVKAQLRRLVPAIHAVVDRAQSHAGGRLRPRAPACKEVAGAVVERDLDLLAESEALKFPEFSLAAAGSVQPAISHYVGPSKVEAMEEPAPTVEGAPADECSVPRLPVAAAITQSSCPAWQSFRALA
jgi:hypothetical protein